MDSRALTKVQSAALVAIIVVAVVGGGAAYVFWGANQPPLEDIRIGVCADLDMGIGQGIWRGAVVAAEEINAEGGILGRNVTIVAEDDDSETGSRDLSVATNALMKLITVDNADFIVSASPFGLVYQDICAEHKKIFFAIMVKEEAEQRVLDNYDKYKYYFTTTTNTTASMASLVDSLETLRKYTGFNKIAYIDQDANYFAKTRAMLNQSLVESGFELVYQGATGWATTDFTSYFGAIEASGAEILCPWIVTQASFAFVKEWYDRQSPVVVWGIIYYVLASNRWDLLEGKCEYISNVGSPTEAGYPFTNKTLATREAFIRQGQEPPGPYAVNSYDLVRFVLADAIKRAGTKETEALIEALEETDVETSMARHFVFTSSHGVMTNSLGPNSLAEDYMPFCLFQWQNGALVPVYPEDVMKEAGATYKLPPWQGPWSNKETT